MNKKWKISVLYEKNYVYVSVVCRGKKEGGREGGRGKEGERERNSRSVVIFNFFFFAIFSSIVGERQKVYDQQTVF